MERDPRYYRAAIGVFPRVPERRNHNPAPEQVAWPVDGGEAIDGKGTQPPREFRVPLDPDMLAPCWRPDSLFSLDA